MKQENGPYTRLNKLGWEPLPAYLISGHINNCKLQGPLQTVLYALGCCVNHTCLQMPMGVKTCPAACSAPPPHQPVRPVRPFALRCLLSCVLQVTSLYLHLVPAMVSWSLRWYTSAGSDQGRRQGGPSGLQPGLLSRLGICSFPAFPGEGSSSGGSSSSGAPGHDLAMELTNESSLSFLASATCAAGRQGRQPTPSATLSTLVLIPMSLYLVWAVLYYLQIFVFSAKKIQQRGYQVRRVGDGEGSRSGRLQMVGLDFFRAFVMSRTPVSPAGCTTPASLRVHALR